MVRPAYSYSTVSNTAQKIKVLSRPASSIQAPGAAVARLPRNYDPAQHPFERAREYTRALNATKLDRMFAKPFLGSLGRGHVDGVYRIANDPLALDRFASASGDGVVKAWDLASREETCQIKAHDNLVRGLAWTRDRRLLSCSSDATVKLWDPYNDVGEGRKKNVPVAQWTGRGAYVSISHHRTAPSFAVCTASSIHIHDTTRPASPPTAVLAWPNASASLTAVALNQTETSLLASTGTDHALIFYDLRTSTPVSKTTLTLAGNAVAWNPMEAFNLAVASEDHNVYLFDMRSPTRALNVLRDHVAAAMDVAWSPTGAELVSASYDSTIRLWRRDRGHARDVYHTKRMQRVFSCAWSADDGFVLSGSDDGDVRLWRAVASDRRGVRSVAQRRGEEYAAALRRRFAHMPEIRRIARHRHLPKAIKRAREIKDEEMAAIRRREENERKHSVKGKTRRKPEREKMVMAAEE
jgi:WD repeat and SOF domain-containing protein 1